MVRRVKTRRGKKNPSQPRHLFKVGKIHMGQSRTRQVKCDREFCPSLNIMQEQEKKSQTTKLSSQGVQQLEKTCLELLYNYFVLCCLISGASYISQSRKILRFCSRTVSSKVLKIIIFMCVLIKYLSGIVKCVQFSNKVNFITNISNSI